MPRSSRNPLPIELALQRGGSHGAFTRGVLDRLLEEPWIRIEAISGTSAGAMNAAALADGFAQHGAAAPGLRPLGRESDARDAILLQINPRERPETPHSPGEILNRLNDISFNSPLMKELRMIALLRQVADPGHGGGARWASMRTHRITTDMMIELGVSSKLNAEWAFVTRLRDVGRRAAGAFLEEHGVDLGSTADLDVLLAEC